MKWKKIAVVVVLACLMILGIAPTTYAAASRPYSIEVDLTNQVVTVYKSSNGAIYKQMLCSTGLDSSPTPTGTFNLPAKVSSSERTEWYYFSKYECYAKYATRITGGILFHSVIYSKKDDSTLRTSTVRNLGSKASHGCIRLSVENAKWIAENCLSGTRVKIFKGKSNPELVNRLKGKTSSGTLRLGSSGSAVTTLQNRLKALGFMPESATGNFKSATETAVRAFQSAAGLTVDGIAGPATQAAMNAVTPVTGTQVALSAGSKGPAVKTMQSWLKTLGFYTGTPDGDYGNMTAAAVSAYQRTKGYTQTGSTSSSLQNEIKRSAQNAGSQAGTSAGSNPGKYTTLRPGMSGDEVLKMQKKLKELGYFTGNPQGNYQNLTTAAVRAFQRKTGLTVDGIAGQVTLSVLYSDSAPAAAGSMNDSSSTSSATSQTDVGSTGYTTLRPGMTGDGVLKLQKRLKELGYFTGNPQGNYKNLTTAAVSAFQKAAGLSTDGIAGPATQKAVYAANAPKAGSTPAQTAPETQTSTSSGTLEFGMSGDDVLKLQKRLQSLGYFTGNPQGNYKDLTYQAVVAFQQAAGLTADGKAGKGTLNALYSDGAPTGTLVTFSQGMSGKAVQVVQEKLIALGYLSGSADGSFGQETYQAVCDYQSANGLKQTGVLTPSLQKSILRK